MRKPLREFRQHPVLESAHVGVLIKEAGQQKPILAYQENKRFIPASNVKILTAYLALQSGLDSTISAQVQTKNSRHLLIQPLADPGFLHPDFEKQNFLDSLKAYDTLTFFTKSVERYGPGWAWEDFDRPFMPEIAAFPLYGNTVRISGDTSGYTVTPRYFTDSLIVGNQPFRRAFDRNQFVIPPVAERKKMAIPFITGQHTTEALLRDTLGEKVIFWKDLGEETFNREIKGQPLDTLVKKMMLRSDNFYAEHVLRQLAKRFLWEGSVSDWFVHHLPAMSDNPVLVDGSGLSRYNLISPSDLCVVLEHQWQQIGETEIRAVYMNGNNSPLRDGFTNFGENIMFKTGSMAGIFCLSGYLKTKAGRILTFSVMINGHRTYPDACKKIIRDLLQQVREKY